MASVGDFKGFTVSPSGGAGATLVDVLADIGLGSSASPSPASSVARPKNSAIGDETGDLKWESLSVSCGSFAGSAAFAKSSMADVDTVSTGRAGVASNTIGVGVLITIGPRAFPRAGKGFEINLE